MICVPEILEKLKKTDSEKILAVPLIEKLPVLDLNPVALYQLLKSQGEVSFFYESNEDSGLTGRYTFMGLDPVSTITINGEVLTVAPSGESFSVQRPFDKLQQILDQYQLFEHCELPPFASGVVGFVGHECIYSMQDITRVSKPGYDFLDDATLMIFKSIIVLDRLEGKLQLISNLFLKPGQGQLEENYLEGIENLNKLSRLVERARSHKLAPLPTGAKCPPQKVESLLKRSQFRSRFSKIKGHIRRGNLFQCVLSNRFQTAVESDPLTIYRVLRHTSPVPYLYYLQLGETALFGASPERFVQVEDGMVETRPIAGTRPRGANRPEDLRLEAELLSDEKEKAEHLMLVDLGRNDIGKVSRAGTVKVTQYMQVERFSNVMHLVSKVRGELKKGIAPLQAFCSCFVAGTLSGAPKRKAIEILLELEPVERGPYGGAILYYDFRGNFDSCITIRSLLVHDKMAYFQAGAGIVADSVEESEYLEIIAKTGAITRTLNQVENGVAK
ncbi:MAG: anthranilate synthase component I family protein [Halobacteriovoraceae bacterium]|jgi:anthranilate synthase component I|nr:anthranilate synthase component I family protein [Halobacteriovoraceae bacterium]